MATSNEWWKAPGEIPAEFLPNHVTYPVCALCGAIITDWPHYDEEVPTNPCCTCCAEELER